MLLNNTDGKVSPLTKMLQVKANFQGKVSMYMERPLQGKVSTWKGTLLPSFFMLTARHFLNLKLVACVKYKQRKYSFVKIVFFAKEFTVENKNIQTDSLLHVTHLILCY